MFTSRFNLDPKLHSSPRTNRGLYAIFALLACLMLFLIYTSTKDVITSIQAQSWPSTRATILESDVVESWRTKRDFLRQRIAQYEPTVTYSYSVAGENHRGHQISFDLSPVANPTLAYKIKNILKPTEKITVFYHPKYPSESVLSPTLNKKSLANLCISLAIFIGCVTPFFLAPRFHSRDEVLLEGLEIHPPNPELAALLRRKPAAQKRPKKPKQALPTETPAKPATTSQLAKNPPTKPHLKRLQKIIKQQFSSKHQP